MDHLKIRKVHVIYKTHLDVGFTALAEDVLKRYDEVFIPKAIRTAEELNRDGQKRFVWTVGSYVIFRYLEHASPENRTRLEEAIGKGWIKWHGLPLTTHTELMDASLFRYGLSLSRSLDRRFGTETTAAKMSDVPGHTTAMIPLLAEAGIRFLHIGINSSSKAVNVPPLFIWKFDNAEVIVNYATWYGDSTETDGLDEAMVFLHSHDNEGPPDADEVREFLAKMKAEYPNAEIVGSTMDAFEIVLRRVKDRLPVITGEIGDTWIHGAATDPLKVGAFRRLLQLRSRWEKERPDGYEQCRQAFSENLLLVPEHTWGMDTKKYLYDYKNWSKKDFQEARKRDLIGEADLLPAGEQTAEVVRREAKQYAGGMIGSYSLFEKSHAEQRKYVTDALAALTGSLSAEAEEVLREDSDFPALSGRELLPGGIWETAAGNFSLNPDGSVTADDRMRIGIFLYQIFDAKTTDSCFMSYNRCLERTYGWARADFAKPGLEFVPGLKSKDYHPSVKRACCTEDSMTVLIETEAEASGLYGCPRQLAISYHICRADGSMKAVLHWKDKDASRIPEALWFGICPPHGTGKDEIVLKKLGRDISPYDIIPGGNHRLHAAEEITVGRTVVVSTDAPVVSIGGCHLYDVDDVCGNPEDGFYFLVFNNRWGTNFNMWYEDDGRAAVRLRKNI